jgi:hypothetical protein
LMGIGQGRLVPPNPAGAKSFVPATQASAPNA